MRRTHEAIKIRVSISGFEPTAEEAACRVFRLAQLAASVVASLVDVVACILDAQGNGVHCSPFQKLYSVQVSVEDTVVFHTLQAGVSLPTQRWSDTARPEHCGFTASFDAGAGDSVPPAFAGHQCAVRSFRASCDAGTLFRSSGVHSRIVRQSLLPYSNTWLPSTALQCASEPL